MNNKEKRKFERVDSLNLSYLLIDAQNDEVEKQTMGRTLNVSEAGILLETHLPVAIGRHMLLSIGLEDELVDIKGRVVHSSKSSESRYELGIEFLDMNEETFRILQKFIKAFLEHQKRLKLDD